MIKVRCRTNLDEFKREDWPQTMVCRPIVGDRVESKDGRQLRVVGITHSRVPVYLSEEANKLLTDGPEPMLIVELNK
jgi:hypothetical protein